MKVLNLVHYDLDGAICTINILNSLTDKSNFRYQGVGYGKIDKYLSIFSKEDFDVLFVTDLNLTQEQLITLGSMKKPNNKIVYIDHHDYSYNLNDFCRENKLDLIIKYDKEYSGCMNTFNFLNSIKTIDISYLTELNEIGNDYDLWKKDCSHFFTKSLPLNDLFWEYNFDGFVSKFKNGYKLNEKDQSIIDKVNKDRLEVLKYNIDNYSIVNDDLNILFKYGVENKFINDYTLYYPSFDFYLLTREVKDGLVQLSLRVNMNNDFTIQDIYTKLKDKYKHEFTCGGHTKSGGIGIQEENFTEFVDIFYDCISELKMNKG